MHHLGPWTIDDVEALPDYGHHSRYELLTAGVLTISPAPGTAHQGAHGNLARLLSMAAPARTEVLGAINVEIPGGRLCQPDIAVVDTEFADTEPTRFPPQVVAAVVEIVSPNSHPQDRIIKPQLYAAARIPVYWRLEIEKTPQLIVSELRLGRYVQTVVAPAGQATVIDKPFRVAVDPGGLVRRAGS